MFNEEVGNKLPPPKVKAERDKGYQASNVSERGSVQGAASEAERPSLAERMAKDKQRVTTIKRRAAGGE